MCIKFFLIKYKGVLLVRLTQQQIKEKKRFIEDYINASNAADGSKLDANANVSHKNIATLGAEIHKDINIQINRSLIYDRIKNRFGKELADEYIRQLEAHEIYVHDETSLNPYCVSISLYPFLLNGLQSFGGDSKPPKHLQSFNGGFINLVFAISAQFAGAVATVEWLLYFDYFARKDYGDDYLTKNQKTIENMLQHTVYALNQPAAARGFQCVREDTTQLSTPEGYKYLHELKEGDTCYVWKNGKIEVEKIKKLNIYDYDSEKDGELLQFKGRNYQQTVTPNHRVVYKKPNTNEYSIKEAIEVFGHSKLSMPIGSDGVEREDYGISDELLKLCVATLTDGSIEGKEVNNNFSGRIRIYKSVNRYGYKEIPQWLDALGIEYTTTNARRNDFGEVVVFNIDTTNSQIILRQLKGTKNEIPYFFKLLSKRQIELVLNTWAKFDGTNNEKYTTLLQCDNEDIRDTLQELATIAGMGSEKYDRVMTKYSSEEEYAVKYLKLFERKDKRVKEYNLIDYKGRVWCPSTDAGVVIFREENGIPYISGNSVFWNISIYDKPYFDAMFGNFVFPDNTKPNWDTFNNLQKFFMKWFNQERTKALLTFPVVTAACLNDGNTLIDKDFQDFIAEEYSEGNAFFTFTSQNAHALSSCCRLKNDIADDINDFSYSLGAGGVATGSMNVITININRLIQDGRDIKEEVEKVHKYQIAFKDLFDEYIEKGMLPVYSAGYITTDKQYLTVGINGVAEAAQYLGYTVNNNEEYKTWVSSILKEISDLNKVNAKKYSVKFNTEFVPAENLGVKNSKWDEKDGYKTFRKCYNSYLYLVEDNDISVIDKFVLHGRDTSQYLDGGSAYHCNLEEYPTKEGFKKLLDVAVKEGCEYFCFNVRVTGCDNCGFINKKTEYKCTKCGSKNIFWATRVIGYLKRIRDFSTERQNEAELRHYSKSRV